jgi:hypothetical protein
MVSSIANRTPTDAPSALALRARPLDGAAQLVFEGRQARIGFEKAGDLC